jgi:putative endonuclease
VIDWRRIFGRKTSLGAIGERMAAKYLKRRGYRILERNLKVHDDEADLVALDPDGCTIVIVEVKTRRDDGTAPEAAITAHKRQYLTRLAMKLQQQARFKDRPLRFDVVAVIVPERGPQVIRHIAAAFDSSG